MTTIGKAGHIDFFLVKCLYLDAFMDIAELVDMPIQVQQFPPDEHVYLSLTLPRNTINALRIHHPNIMGLMEMDNAEMYLFIYGVK